MGKTIYVTSKINKKEYCKTNGHFTRHLKKNGLTYQQYYEKYITKKQMLCMCGKSKTFYQQSETYANSCGDSVCIGKLIKETKANWTTEQRLNDSVNKKKWAKSRTREDLDKSREIRKQTNNKRYGVDYTTQASTMMEKSKITKLVRYGNEFYSNPKLTSESWRAKTSNDIALITEKKRNTCMEKYGVDSPFFLPDVRKKSAISNSIGREFVMPSGKIIRVRGYEDEVINILLTSYIEDDLIVDDTLIKYNLPIFEYVNLNLHTMRYYPDIYIPKENKIIEVKGRWWWDGNGLGKHASRLLNNLKKRQAVLDAGFQYEVWLFEDRKNYRILKDDRDFNIK